jgi:hypothetical protein
MRYNATVPGRQELSYSEFHPFCLVASTAFSSKILLTLNFSPIEAQGQAALDSCTLEAQVSMECTINVKRKTRV